MNLIWFALVFHPSSRESSGIFISRDPQYQGAAALRLSEVYEGAEGVVCATPNAADLRLLSNFALCLCFVFNGLA